MRNLSVRQQQIIDLISRQEYCTIEALSELFSVTTQTIRRDINKLCNLRLAQRHHGGVSLPPTLVNRSYVSRSHTNQDDKRAIAQSVVEQIPDGCTLFLGIGTTIALIAELLVNHTQLRVVTNNFQAAHILSQYEQIEIWIAGGKLRTNDGDITGEGVSTFFSKFSADIGIVGCAAVSQVSESNPLDLLSNEHQHKPIIECAMEHELQEAEVSQNILIGSRQKWLVANPTKWHRKANAKVANLCQFDQVFSGQN
ncbi:RNA polymerase subunit sigma-70 [Vibrio sp. UCD-FRSSP16_10]|uniref:DeoR/GlpR family DNA-binding transcription regulator n=1 Tax=unclassified Vibrio TaxID=2614977 RepID=UPI0007FCB643|nr:MULTISPECIES: DeoR/GlpR family DNA-binding transcription regulator [unclassified Vibrio]OBT14786.1 RNA polymerase subunit sigma-70 [Vibrio sp. UCD-FRSSP16_30]OBT20075.1 RNA polymerase subunit sigma-70 [Vibrio sp. UCD-FRSSP16_10]